MPVFAVSYSSTVSTSYNVSQDVSPDPTKRKGLVLLNSPPICHQSQPFYLIPLLNTLVQTGWAALHAAAQKGHLRVVELLSEANADVNIKTNVRVTIHIHDT